MTITLAAPPRRSLRLTRVGSLLLSRGLLSMCFESLGLLLPLVRLDLDLTFSQAGALSSASTLVYALMQIPAGYLSDRMGPKRVLFAGYAGTSILTLGFGFVGSFEQALLLQTVFGFFRALAFAPGLVLMASWFSADRRSTALGMTVAANFGFTMVLSLTGPSIADAVGWRPVLVSVATAGVAAAVFFGRVSNDIRPSTLQSRRGVNAVWLLRQQAMWWIAAIQFIRLAIVVSYAFWIPTFLVEDHGLDLKLAGFIVAAGAGMSALSNLAGGYVSDRLRRPLVVIGGALTVLMCTSMAMATIDITAVVIAAFLVNALFVQVYFGPLFALPVELLKLKNEGLATGFGNFFANLGAFAFAFTLGAIRDATGSFQMGFASLSVIALVGVLITVRLSRLGAVATQPTEAGAG